MRRQEQLQAEHDRAEDDVFAQVALKEKLDKEVRGGHGLKNRGEEEGKGKEGRGRMPERRLGERGERRESKAEKKGWEMERAKGRG